MRDEGNIARRAVLRLRIAGVVLIALGVLVLVQSLQIPQGGGYRAVGPRAFPTAVGVGLLVLSAVFLLRTTVWPDHDLVAQAIAEDRATHWPTIALVALALVVYAFALRPLGYVIATTLFLPAVARTLGSTKPLRDLLIAVVLSVVVYEGFTRVLGVRLPAGLLQGVL